MPQTAVSSKGNTYFFDAVSNFLEEAESRNRVETLRQYRRHLKAFGSKKKLGAITRDDIRNEYPNFSTIVKLAILTGQRRSEIASIFPDWIEKDILVFPSSITKNKRTHRIPITPRVFRLLERSPFGKGDAFNGWSNGRRRVDKEVNIDHWTLHDLRRTFATIHAEIGTPIHITERLLNHVSGTISGVAAVYSRHSYIGEMREALENY